jgi:hypothetical protein
MVMKTWNTPEISELNIKETANGCVDFYCEFWFLNNDKKCTPDPTNDPS